MAELAIVMPMITLTSTAASILGLIKRRCGASQAITELTRKCAGLVNKIQTLLKTLEGDAQMPRDTRGISTALRLRREEFDAVLKNLEEMNRRTKRTSPIDRTEKFIKAQGWAKKMEAIHNDLVHLRNGIENIVSNWDVAQFVATKFEEVVTVDLTKEQQSSRVQQHSEYEAIGSRTPNYVDRILMTMVKLTDANKEALNRHGNLAELSLPDALFRASAVLQWTDRTCSMQLLQRSAELLHLEANCWMGLAYKYGDVLEKNLKQAVPYFRVASSRGDVYSMNELIAHYHRENDMRNVWKYVETAYSNGQQWDHWIPCDYKSNEHSFESGEFEQQLIRTSQSMCALDRSFNHFFGLCARKSKRKAVEVLPKLNSGSYSVHFNADDSASFDICFHTRPHHYGWYYAEHLMREYLDFLFESNQFLPFFIWSHDIDIYSRRQWKRFAVQAAKSHCVDAHIFLAHYYSSSNSRRENEMKRHLRIAADSGHSQARSICRQVFGKRVNLSKRIKLSEGKRDGSATKEKQQLRKKRSEKSEDTSPMKRTAPSANECDFATD